MPRSAEKEKGELFSIIISVPFFRTNMPQACPRFIEQARKSIGMSGPIIVFVHSKTKKRKSDIRRRIGRIAGTLSFSARTPQ